MIHPDCFTIDWLQAKRREIRALDEVSKVSPFIRYQEDSR